MLVRSQTKILHAGAAGILAAGVLLLPAARAWAQDKAPEPATLPGCTDQIHAGGPGGTQERFFPAPMPAVKQAAIDALHALEFEVKEKNDGSLEGHKTRHIGLFVGSGGEKVVLKLREGDEDGHKGTIVAGKTKKNMIGIVGQKTWTSAVLAQTACVLQKDSK